MVSNLRYNALLYVIILLTFAMFPLPLLSTLGVVEVMQTNGLRHWSEFIPYNSIILAGCLVVSWFLISVTFFSLIRKIKVVAQQSVGVSDLNSALYFIFSLVLGNIATLVLHADVISNSLRNIIFNLSLFSFFPFIIFPFAYHFKISIFMKFKMLISIILIIDYIFLVLFYLAVGHASGIVALFIVILGAAICCRMSLKISSVVFIILTIVTFSSLTLKSSIRIFYTKIEQAQLSDISPSQSILSLLKQSFQETNAGIESYDANLAHYVFRSTQENNAFVNMMSRAVSRLNHFDKLALVVDRTPSVIPHWGCTNYLSIITSVIPRALYPNKENCEIGNEFGRRYNILAPDDSTTSVNLNPLTHAWMAGGWPAVLSDGMIFSSFIGFFMILFRRIKSNWVRIQFFSVCLIKLSMPETTLINFIGGAMQLTLIGLIFILMLRIFVFLFFRKSL